MTRSINATRARYAFGSSIILGEKADLAFEVGAWPTCDMPADEGCGPERWTAAGWLAGQHPINPRLTADPRKKAGV